MRLERIAEAVMPVAIRQPKSDVELTGLSLDSRKVQPGHLFAALSGTKEDGAKYARDAEARGAAAILTERPEPLTGLPQLVVRNARLSISLAARVFHGRPDLRLRMGAITGTNGKSTTAYLVRHILRGDDLRCGLLGTVEYDLGRGTMPAPMTTPDAPELFSYLRDMADNACAACVMEVSSHSLLHHRVAGIDFRAAGFTNLTQDHLDIHRTMDEYRRVKGLLFQDLLPNATAVINLDDEAGRRYAKLTHAQVLSCRIKSRGRADLRAYLEAMDIHGTTFSIESPWGKRTLHWKLVGEHNLQNAVIALGLALALGDGCHHTFNFDRALNALERFPGIPGRLEPVGDGLAPFRVLVDYAHTDDALINVMTAMRELRPSRLLVVFGCGGDRDKGKRPKMGHAVEKMADLGFVTSDNPRSEEPRAILADICVGITQPGKFIVEEDRARAIEMAVREARAGDVVLIAGKGHEDYQIIGKEKRHFDDREHARNAMERRFGAHGQAAGG